jgi:O-antigen/teichoic acid export membrane protein
MNFKVQMQAGLIATFGSGILAIYLAWNGWGVWALAMQFFAATVIRAVLLWVLYRWRPARRFSLARMREMFSFGSYVFFSGLLGVFSSQLHALLIGRYYDAASLGYFNRATGTRELLQGVMTTVYNSVAFPLFSSFAHDRERLRDSMRKSTVAMMAINLPVMVGLLVTADDLIPTLFGEQWVPSVPYMQVLCLGGIIWPLQVSPLNMLKALGRSKLMFRLGLVRNSVMVGVVLLTAQISILAIAWGLVAVSVTAFLINAHYSGRMVNYGALLQLRDVLPYALLTAAMAVIVMLVGAAVSELATGWRALAQVTVGAVFYLGTMHMLKMEASSYAKDLLKLR